MGDDRKQDPAWKPRPEAAKKLNELVATKLFGIDLTAKTRAEIGAAAFSGFFSNFPNSDGSDSMKFDWHGTVWSLSHQGSAFGYGEADGNDGYGLWFWDHRGGEPWQGDIEAHVAAWRKTVAAYCTDWELMRRVIQNLCQRGIEVEITAMAVGKERYEVEMFESARGRLVPGYHWYHVSPSLPYALCVVGLRAIGVEVGSKCTTW